MSRRTVIAVVVTGAALVAAPAAAAPTKRIKVEDNFFSPRKATVKQGTTIRWTWPEDGGDVHDVKLVKAPKGVKKFHSDPGSGGFTYRRKLSKPGTYKLLCTFHEDEMRLTIRVKRTKKKRR